MSIMNRSTPRISTPPSSSRSSYASKPRETEAHATREYLSVGAVVWPRGYLHTHSIRSCRVGNKRSRPGYRFSPGRGNVFPHAASVSATPARPREAFLALPGASPLLARRHASSDTWDAAGIWTGWSSPRLPSFNDSPPTRSSR